MTHRVPEPRRHAVRPSATRAGTDAAVRPRIVVADDSSLMRRILVRTLTDDGFDVVGEAQDGDEALALCIRHRPDAMTLDLHMPGTDGMAVLRALGAGGPPAVPTVVVSAFSPAQGARAVDALAGGAFDLAAKPGVGESVADFSAGLGEKLRAAAASGSARRAPVTPRNVPRHTPGPASGRRLVLIACSTGGPRALAELLPALPSPLGAGVLVVQHMPAGFTGSLAARLDGTSALHVQEAGPTAAIAPGDALIAPGGHHLRLTDARATTLTNEPAIGGLRPRADLTIADAARLWGPRLLLVVLTGMGRDGLDGAREVRRRGGRILVESEDTCTVYGMPRAVAEAGLADQIVPLPDMAAAILEELAA
ncbi:chemotaxis protein CheB [Patulibacter sp. NPDC049589]|uniref:chemotaxis protein CheB n=1 Tax=Patulibacter sp. NPDC049589 TaxID=3154731 RepID=UPI00342B0D23